MITATKQLRFEAAHRLLGHEGKCSNIHGHNYVVEISMGSHQLDEVGRVIDFAAIKDTVGKWIDENWDHALLLWEQDPLMNMPWPAELKVVALEFNPTAEGMACYLYRKVLDMITPEIHLSYVKVWENQTSWAEV